MVVCCINAFVVLLNFTRRGVCVMGVGALPYDSYVPGVCG